MSRSATNGQKRQPTEQQQPATTDGQAPPWSNVDPWEVVGQLQAQVARQAGEMAAMRVYIAQLHDGLAVAAASVPQEQPAEGVG